MNLFLIIIIAILFFDYILTFVVDTLNVKALKTDLPSEFKDYYDADKYKKSQEYLKINTKFSLIASGISVIFILSFIVLGGFGFFDSIARGLTNNELISALIFAFLILIMSTIINIPFSVYRTFIIEEKFGFNKTTPITFIGDIFKSLIITMILGGPLFALIVHLFTITGQYAWLYCWTVFVIFELFVIFIAPVVILPLFNKFNPIEEGELKATIENYAKSQSFALSGVYVMDGSKRSSKSNAFFTGLGKFRKIALFDTLINNHTVNELVAVLAHEIGHFKKKHILKSLFMSFITSALMFFIMSFFIKNQLLFDAFKVEHLSVYASLFFFGFLYSPINTILAIFGNVLSRKHEFEADEFAVSTFGHKDVFISALKKLSVDNLSNLTPHPLKVFLEYSHPPVLQRIEAINKVTSID